MTYAFFGKPEVKEEWLARIADWKAKGELFANTGYWWQIGESPWTGIPWRTGERLLWEDAGIPDSLCRLIYGIYERLDVSPAREFPERFLSAIPVGADLSKITHQFLGWLLETSIAPMAVADTFKKEGALIAEVARLVKNEEPDREQLRVAIKLLDDTSYGYQTSGLSIFRGFGLGFLRSTEKVGRCLHAASTAAQSIEEPRKYVYLTIEHAGKAECTYGGRGYCYDVGLYLPYHKMMAEQLLVMLRNAPVPEA